MKRQSLLSASRLGFGTSLVALSLVAQPSFSCPQLPPAIIEVNTTVASALQGVVHDEDQLPLAGVNIYLKGTNIGTTTNEKGEFVFPQKLNAGDIIVFSFVGLETKEYVVPSNAPDPIQIVMQLDSTIMMGELAVEYGSESKRPLSKRIWHKMKSIF